MFKVFSSIPDAVFKSIKGEGQLVNLQDNRDLFAAITIMLDNKFS